MKKIFFFILFFLLSSYSISQYQFSGDWRWRNDDGDVYTASWRDSILIPVVLNDYGNIRLRIELHNYDADSNNVVLFYTSNRNEWSDSLWSWTRIAVEINNSDTGLFYLSNSEFLEDDKTYLDNMLLPGRNTHYPYQKTVTIDSTNELMLETDKQKTIELEYCIKPSKRILPGSTYYFMLGTREYPFSIYPNLSENLPALMVPPTDWNFQPTGSMGHFNAICMDKNGAIWICGIDDSYYKGYIMKSTDGGEHWITQWSDSAYEVMDLSFYGDYGWAVVNQNQDYGQTLRSTDGGNTWNLYGNLYEFNEMLWCQFFDENNGYALEDYSGGNKLLKTTDSGKTWQRYSIKDYQYPLRGYFINSEIGWFTAGSGTDIMKTTNGGLNWVELPNVPSFSNLNAVFFINENVGWAVGNRGIILKTKDGGEHWILQTYSEEPDKELTNLFFINEKTGWAIGEKGLIKITRNGGNNWFEIEAPTCNWLNDIYFIDENNGWIVGENGVILKTSNGGLTFVENTTSSIVINNYLLEQNFPNPFNPNTTISYSIPKSAKVELKVFNLLGQEIATLVNEEKSPGNYEVNFNASNLPSGVYIYKMKAGEYVQTRKMILLK